MNRSEDLGRTLRTNLDDNRRHASTVEFVVICFDEDDVLLNRLAAEFPEEIASGYLRAHGSREIDSWHFGRAKNAFMATMRGRLYSSLDADNFVSADETEQVLDLFARHGDEMVVHHFSGSWGDGTCGRITMGARMYRDIGYDPRFLPRQYDEMDLIISTLMKYPRAPYVTYFRGGALGKSGLTSRFTRKSGLRVKNVVVKRPPGRAPLNPREPDYAEADPALALMLRFNRSSCFAKNSADPRRKARYADQAANAACDLVGHLGGEAADIFLRPERPEALPGQTSGVPVFTCVKDEWLLAEWLDHYRAAGAGPFFIIDDGSEPPVSRLFEAPDIHVFTPRCGLFRTGKSAWIMALMRRFLGEGQWALTVDADEFVDFGSGPVPPLQPLVEELERRGDEVAPGILVDLLPGPAHLEMAAPLSARDVLDVFDRHLFLETGDGTDYARIPAIRWAWGAHWRKSFCIDARFHLFGTVDVLRKAPLVRNGAALRLNQGFHDVRRSGAGLSREQWSGAVLPIRHYKLAHLFSPFGRARMSERARQFAYHDQTANNVGKLVSIDIDALRSLCQSSPTRRYDPGLFWQDAYGDRVTERLPAFPKRIAGTLRQLSTRLSSVRSA